MKIYFKYADTKDLKSLMRSLYSHNGYACPTYLDSEFNKIQCAGSRRSFEDLLIISKTYFPKVTKEELMQCLIDIKIKFYFCNNINKIVFHYHGIFFINEINFNSYKNRIFQEGTYTPRRLINVLKKL